MAGKDNLRVPTSEEAREIGKKGGIASGKARRKKANLKKALNTILVADVSSEKLAETLESMGYERTNESAMVLAMVQKAIKGDVKAFEQIAKLTDNEKDSYDIAEQKERTNLLKEQVKKAKAENELDTAGANDDIIIVDRWGEDDD